LRSSDLFATGSVGLLLYTIWDQFTSTAYKSEKSWHGNPSGRISRNRTLPIWNKWLLRQAGLTVQCFISPVVANVANLHNILRKRGIRNVIMISNGTMTWRFARPCNFGPMKEVVKGLALVAIKTSTHYLYADRTFLRSAGQQGVM